MKFKYFLFFFLNVALLHAQDVHLKGIIIDAQTRQTIAAATVSIPAKKLYFRADNRGEFDIPDAKISVIDSINFSCVGYQTKKIEVDELSRQSIIELAPVVNLLKEVKVSLNQPPLIDVGSKRKSGYESYYPRPGVDFVMYMEGSKNVKGILQTVGFFLTNGHGMFKGGDVTAPFRIRIFDVDTNGMPGKEITKDSIIVSAKKDLTWFDADISAYHIQNPDSGFFVSFSLLDYKYYKRITKIEPNAVMLSGEHETFGQKLPTEESGLNAIFNCPRLCQTWDEFKPSRSYFWGYTAEDNGLHWLKMYNYQSYMIRAAIAPE